MARKVELYHQPGCGDCRQAREFLSRQEVPFTAYDISSDPEARRRLIEELDSKVTATLVIDGEVIRGFQQNRRRVEELLST